MTTATALRPSIFTLRPVCDRPCYRPCYRYATDCDRATYLPPLYPQAVAPRFWARVAQRVAPLKREGAERPPHTTHSSNAAAADGAERSMPADRRQLSRYVCPLVLPVRFPDWSNSDGRRLNALILRQNLRGRQLCTDHVPVLSTRWEGVFARALSRPLALLEASEGRTPSATKALRYSIGISRLPGRTNPAGMPVGEKIPLARKFDLVRNFRGPFQKTCCPSATKTGAPNFWRRRLANPRPVLECPRRVSGRLTHAFPAWRCRGARPSGKTHQRLAQDSGAAAKKGFDR
jgi:hypothetical protein